MCSHQKLENYYLSNNPGGIKKTEKNNKERNICIQIHLIPSTNSSHTDKLPSEEMLATASPNSGGTQTTLRMLAS